jgi:hypothetical protein
MSLTAKEMSENKGESIFVQYRHRWTEKTAREFGRHNMMFLQMYITKHRKELLYDEKIHGQIDVVSYVINRDKELTEEDKDFYLYLNIGRIQQLIDDNLGDIVLFKTPKAIIMPIAILSKIETMGVIQHFGQVDDSFKIVDKDICFSVEGIHPIVVSKEKLYEKEKDVFFKNRDPNFMRFVAETYLKSQVGDFLFFDMEYRIEHRNQNHWTRIYTECAIMDSSLNFIYSGSMKDDDSMYSFIMESLSGKIVLVKGATVEIEYFDRLFLPNVYLIRQDYRDKRKTYPDVRRFPFIVVDIEIFGVEKYPHNKHVPERELMFFKENFEEKINKFLHEEFKTQNIVYALFEQRAFDILTLRWSWVLMQTLPSMKLIYLDKFRRFLLYPAKLRVHQVDDFDIKVDFLNHQKMLFYLSYCDVFYHRGLYCYFHNELNCNKCSFSARNSRYSHKSFKTLVERDLFVTYINYVTGGMNGMYLVLDNEFYEYLDAFENTNMELLFSLIADEEVDLLEYVKVFNL